MLTSDLHTSTALRTLQRTVSRTIRVAKDRGLRNLVRRSSHNIRCYYSTCIRHLQQRNVTVDVARSCGPASGTITRHVGKVVGIRHLCERKLFRAVRHTTDIVRHCVCFCGCHQPRVDINCGAPNVIRKRGRARVGV